MTNLQAHINSNCQQAEVMKRIREMYDLSHSQRCYFKCAYITEGNKTSLDGAFQLHASKSMLDKQKTENAQSSRGSLSSGYNLWQRKSIDIYSLSLSGINLLKRFVRKILRSYDCKLTSILTKQEHWLRKYDYITNRAINIQEEHHSRMTKYPMFQDIVIDPVGTSLQAILQAAPANTTRSGASVVYPNLFQVASASSRVREEV